MARDEQQRSDSFLCRQRTEFLLFTYYFFNTSSRKALESNASVFGSSGIVILFYSTLFLFSRSPALYGGGGLEPYLVPKAGTAAR